uniref:Si:ch73-126o18.1 n=1 Tax=Oncorhynchus kisutch TaxID=8019 RepID=A0A8C7DYP6_ONCKI
MRGVAAQSSLFYWEYSPSKVIDGNRNSNYNYGGSCSSTAFNTNPWWRVDLLDVYRVTAVNITNRGDCCPERLDGAEIHIGNSLKNNGINNPRYDLYSSGAVLCLHYTETNTFQCNEMEGQYVVVVIPGQNKILTLCEVEVFATNGGEDENPSRC